MAISLRELQDNPLTPESVLVSCGIVRKVTARLERYLYHSIRPEPRRLNRDWREDAAQSWEDDLAHATARRVCDAFDARGILVRLGDNAGGTRLRAWRTQSGALDDTDTFREPMGFEREALQNGRMVSVDDLQTNSAFAALDRVFPNAKSAVAVPMMTDTSSVVGSLAMGFDRERAELADEHVDILDQIARHLGYVLGVHHRIERLRRDERKQSETRCVASRDGLPSASPGFSAAVLNGGHGREPCTYVAGARGTSGETRLFAARAGVLGIGSPWETLTLDLAFRAGCLTCQEPAEVVDLFGRTLSSSDANLGCEFRVSCADVSDSGREFACAGSASQMVYEHRRQMIEEAHDGNGASADLAPAKRNRRLALHSGDVVIFYTCQLPDVLAERHAVQRRLAGLLAKSGRRSVELIGAKVAALLREYCRCKHRNPALILLRSE